MYEKEKFWEWATVLFRDQEEEAELAEDAGKVWLARLGMRRKVTGVV